MLLYIIILNKHKIFLCSKVGAVANKKNCSHFNKDKEKQNKNKKNPY